jgi:CheY-like chemotaxis protein
MGSRLGSRSLLLQALPQGKIAMHILIADDDPVGREISRHLLEHHGHTVVGVAHGIAALAVATDQDFDAILLDLYMPGIDGFAVAAALAPAIAQHGRPRLIALSAGVEGASIARLRAAGFHAGLSKPLRLAELLAALDNAV